MKSVIGRYRTDEDVSRSAGIILKTLGLSKSSAIDLFFRQVVLNKALPFELRIPNDVTMDAINELNHGGGELFDSFDDLLHDSEEPICLTKQEPQPSSSGILKKQARQKSKS